VRLAAHLEAPVEEATALVRAQIRGAVAGGVDVVQIREKGLCDRDYAAFLGSCLDITRGTPCRLIVNDRLDLALAVGADGVHLREESVAVEAVRAIVHHKFVVGRSIHSAGAAAMWRTADYLIAGSVFETASKPDGHATLGLDGLRAVVNAADRCPVWGIGGITADRMRAVVGAGARGVAAIGAFFPRLGAADITEATEEVARHLRFSLDRAAELS
jgi:thiamine-phosphate pyrophosphorylase